MNHLQLTPPDKETTRFLMQSPWVAMDTEFDGPGILPNPSKKEGKGNRPMPCQLRAELVGFSLWAPGCPWEEGGYWQLCRSKVQYISIDSTHQRNQHWLYNFLKAYDGRVFFHNALADLTVLSRSFPLPKNAWDTMVLAWLLGKRPPGKKKKGLSLDALIRGELGVQGGKSFKDTFQGRGASEVPPAEMAPYAARDAWYTGRLAERFLAELEAWPGVVRAAEEVEMPLLYVITDMVRHGVPINPEAMRAAEAQLGEKLEEVRKEFYELTTTYVDMPTKVKVDTGETYKNGNPKLKTVEEMWPVRMGADVTSDHQVRRWLYDELGWWWRGAVDTTASGEPSVDAANVEKHLASPEYYGVEAARLRLQASKLSKLRGTYVHPFPLYAEARGTGRVHCDIHQTGTETGRFSSSRPNLQNLPRFEEEYHGLKLPNIRGAVEASEGCVFVGADYGQLELRIVAHFSKDENLCRAFNEDLDPHMMMVERVKQDFGVDISRDEGKATNFKAIYRISARALGFQLGIPKQEAARLIKSFFKQYPRVREYHDRAVRFAREHGYISTIGGFVRWLDYPPGGCEKTGSTKPTTNWCGCKWCRKASLEDNKAINTPVQGTAGVLMKRAMVALYEKWRGTPNRILMQVHDELLCEVPDDGNQEQALRDLRACMENVAELRVPLVAEGKIGKTWAQLK